MGLRRQYVDYIDSVFHYDGIGMPKMLELGNQYVRECLKSDCLTGKEYWTGRGFSHTSIDINGMDGAIPIDAASDLGDDHPLCGSFDVVTDIGVSCFTDMIPFFYNLYSFCRPDGVVIHILPKIGSKWNAPEKLSYNDCKTIVKVFNKNGHGTFDYKEIDGVYGKLCAFSSIKGRYET